MSDVEALAGHSIFTRDPRASTQVHCALSEQESGVTARIEVRRSDGTSLGMRELSAGPGECAALREPIAVILLMLLDREPASREPSTSAKSTRSFGLGASVSGLNGSLPRTDVGLGLVLIPQINEQLHARVDAGYWLPVTAQTSEGVGGNFRALSLASALCANLWSKRRLDVSLCGGAQLTVLQAKAHNLRVAHREARFLGQGSVALELSSRWGRTELRADLGPIFTFARPRFYLIQGGGSELDVHQPTWLGAIFRLALIIWAP